MTGEKRTKKQVISGFHRPVCGACKVELRPECNDVAVVDYADYGAYQMWAADLWKCPNCGVEIIGGFGNGPLVGNWEPTFETCIKKMEDHARVFHLKEGSNA
jgi:predicted RNA-binding Zn-ribbon protein involved in translation (DUF1610 family)